MFKGLWRALARSLGWLGPRGRAAPRMALAGGLDDRFFEPTAKSSLPPALPRATFEHARAVPDTLVQDGAPAVAVRPSPCPVACEPALATILIDLDAMAEPEAEFVETPASHGPVTIPYQPIRCDRRHVPLRVAAASNRSGRGRRPARPATARLARPARGRPGQRVVWLGARAA